MLAEVKNKRKKIAVIDTGRIVAALLVVAIHTSPLTFAGELPDFILTRIIARIAVPFFFMTTGYFLAPAMAAARQRDMSLIKKYLIKTGLIYGAAILLYLPLGIYAGYWKGINPGLVLKEILFEGTFYHLWYLPALMTGVLIVTLLYKKLNMRVVVTICLVLYIIGLMGDSYYGAAVSAAPLKMFYEGIFNITEYTRNGLFYAPVFLSAGLLMAIKPKAQTRRFYLFGTVLSAGLMLSEGLLLHHLEWQRHDSMYIMLLPCMYFLFRLILDLNHGVQKKFRQVSLIIYIIHPWIIVIVRGAAKALKMSIMSEQSLIHYLCVSLISSGIALAAVYLKNKNVKIRPETCQRAWAEVDLRALAHNAAVLQQMLPNKCRLMPVIKADAYGHGSVRCAKQFNQLKIFDFAVSTLAEAITLRENKIKGNILILGYTDPYEAHILNHYRLTQTIPDLEYARLLNEGQKTVAVHIKVDTGMHRLGTDYENLEELEEIFNCEHLKVTGMFSHLCVADSLKQYDVSYTKAQIKHFYEVTGHLKAKGYPTGRLHIQNSYGVLNYPGIKSDYARVGIAIYGVLSQMDENYGQTELEQVLSLRAKVAMVKTVAAAQTVGYGRAYQTRKEMRVATVTIGYADGLPRALGEKGAYVLIKGKKAPVVGRICMDQMMIDVSGIDDVKGGDVVTLLGHDGSERIACEQLAGWSGTITNEILSRLGKRLEHIYH